MKKFEFFLIILVFLMLGIAFYFNKFLLTEGSSSHNKALGKQNAVHSKKANTLSNSEERIIDKETPSLFSEISVFREEQKDKHSTDKNLENNHEFSKTTQEEIENEKQKDSLKKKTFKTTDEVMDALFPNFEEQVGEKKYEEFITTFPFAYLKLKQSIDGSFNFGGLTSEQEEKFEELWRNLTVDLHMALPDYKYTGEEGDKIINKIKRGYIPKFINIVTEKQRENFVKLVKKIRKF